MTSACISSLDWRRGGGAGRARLEEAAAAVGKLGRDFSVFFGFTPLLTAPAQLTQDITVPDKSLNFFWGMKHKLALIYVESPSRILGEVGNPLPVHSPDVSSTHLHDGLDTNLHSPSNKSVSSPFYHKFESCKRWWFRLLTPINGQ